MGRYTSLLSAGCLTGLLAACSPPPPLQHDAYIWQRAWHPSLVSAIQQSAPQIRSWRVLAAEASADGALQTFDVDWNALNASQRSVIMVIRIDGQLPIRDGPLLQQQILALKQRWQRHTHLTGLEIDHDCASARLAHYSRFLANLHRQLGCALRLSITALPSWLDAPNLDDVLSQVDEAVLQVHAVQNPQQGLFNPQQAERWITAFSLHHTPFRVALPTYGSRVAYDDAARVVAVTSEAPELNQGARQQEWVAAPQQVEDLLNQLNREPVAELRGVVWFRLPTGEDQRAWGLETWHAVMRGEPLHPRVMVSIRPGEEAGLYQVVLQNRGSSDAMLPSILSLPCPLGDALQGYSASPANGGYRFTRTQQGLLHPGQQQIVGWLRCPNGAPHGQV